MFRSTPSASHVDKIFFEAETSADPSTLVSSWRRCINIHKLRPDGALRPARLERHVVTVVRQANDDLVRAAREPMEHLLSLLAGSDHMVFLTDADGIVVDTRSPRTNDFWQRPRGDWVGTDFSEASQGTNGIGTVLYEKRPLTIAGRQHFHFSNTVAVCSGAPVYDATGALRGCVNLAASAAHDDPLKSSLMLAAAGEAAWRIEFRLFATAHSDAKLVVASPLAPNPTALLAVDRSGAVVGATRAARRLLGITSRQLGGILSLDQISGTDESPDLTKSSAERRAIKAALVAHQGNVSAAARAVGVSRSTLHRKIAEYAIRLRKPDEAIWPSAPKRGRAHTASPPRS